MAEVHGKDTYISVDGDDISQWCDASELNREADTHQLTGYGKDAHVHKGGLLKGNGSVSGFYDSSATGPRAILDPLVGQNVTLIRRTEGTGNGKPQQSVNVVIQKYTESNPVADYIRWSCDFLLSDVVTSTTQP